MGEFDQKGAVKTKWGTKEELQSLTKKAKELGVGIYFDAVLNHKAGADRKEKCRVVKVRNDQSGISIRWLTAVTQVDENDRNKEIGEPYEIEAWLGFDFPGRKGKYSEMVYQ